MSSAVEPGEKVLVAKPSGHLYEAEEEAGVVLGVGCEYKDTETGEDKQDGIMVKLQISNIRGIFSPDLVTPFAKSGMASGSPIPSRRRLRRARVTPSPSLPDQSNSQPGQGTDLSNRGSQGQVQENPGDTEEPDTPMSSKYFVKDESTEDQSSDEKTGDDIPTQNFRVQRSATSSTKCQACKKFIAKNLLKLQLTERKRGWYHVACARTTFVSFPPAEEMEGFQDLHPAEQRTLAGTALYGDGRGPQLTEAGEEKGAESSVMAVSNEEVPSAAVPMEVLEEEDDNMIHASESESDDEHEMPFWVEYAATGRATCKGCDERIQKGTLRVAERPLFRGKPGFVVFRHLNCTVFTGPVSGARRIRKADRVALAERVEESKRLVEIENQELEPDELVQASFPGEIRSAPPGLAASLLPFQVEGSSWMIHQEKHVPEIRGGILADEMGMGKTIQTITTILDNRPNLQHCAPGAKHPPAATDLEARRREESLWNEGLDAWKQEMEKANVPKKLLVKKKGVPLGSRAGTLVVCPVVALFQWKEEIKKFTEDNALTVCCYHGPNRTKEFPPEVLTKYDVVLTTFQVIEADFRKMVSPNKVKCPNCGGSFKIDKLRVHLKYFCGESAQRTAAQARQRRTADRHPRDNRPNRGSNNSKGGKKGQKSKNTFSAKQKPSMTSKAKRAPSRTVVRAPKRTGYDSDSDLSIADDIDQTPGRPTRSSATAATKRLSASAKQWGAGDDASDSEEFQENSDDSSEPSSEEDEAIIESKQPMETDPSEEEDSESEDEATMKRVRKKQKLELNRAKTTRGRGKKSFEEAGKEKKKPVGKGKKVAAKKASKKMPKDDPTSSSDSSESEADPMAGIDLNKLLQEAMEGSKASVLHSMLWWRVVLDEAHFIKSRNSQTAAAAFSLTSIHRWCLSGTPLQNRVGELYSLIRFLRIDPMAHYFCRKEGCDCKSVHYRMLHGKCQECGHGAIQHYSHFNKHVLNPIQRAGYQGDGRRAMMKLKNEVLDKSLLRRTKQTRAEDMNLPPRVVNIKTIRLHPVEDDFYNGLYTQTKSSFNDYVNQGTLLNNYAHIFDLLTKMRQAVDHPYLIVYSKKNAGKFSSPNAAPVANGTIDCELCHEPPTDRVVSSCCGAAFCRSCVIDYMTPALETAQQNGTNCPSCRDPFTVDLSQQSSDIVDDGTLTLSATEETGSPTAFMPLLKEMSHVSSGSILRRINLAEFATSTKIEALVQELVEMRQERPGSKALVFSQFVNMLDLVRWKLHSDPCLQGLGLGVRILHGGMNVQSRDAALKDFREDPNVRVLLMSLKAGGVALNLTVANEAYLLDPWWNPAAEMQAIDRTHRLGQYRPIRAVRFIAEGTVEERVLQLQEKKRLVFDGTVGRDAASLKMLTVDDMKSLFT